MALSAADTIHEILDAKPKCPSCQSLGPFTVEENKPGTTAADDDTVPGEKTSYDSFKCPKCGQRWTVSYRLIYSPTVEYRNDVGDMAGHKDGML